MNKKTITSIVLGVLLSSNLFAFNDRYKNIEEFDIDSIIYIEDEPEFDLGFDTADYLPEDFNPYEFYFNLNTVQYVEDDIDVIDTEKHLPADFNAYADPTDYRSVSYIDANDDIVLDFDPKENLPKDFNPYAKK